MVSSSNGCIGREAHEKLVASHMHALDGGGVVAESSQPASQPTMQATNQPTSQQASQQASKPASQQAGQRASWAVRQKGTSIQSGRHRQPIGQDH